MDLGRWEEMPGYGGRVRLVKTIERRAYLAEGRISQQTPREGRSRLLENGALERKA